MFMTELGQVYLTLALLVFFACVAIFEMAYELLMLIIFIKARSGKEPWASMYKEMKRYEQEQKEQSRSYKHDMRLLRDIHNENMLSIIRGNKEPKPQE